MHSVSPCLQASPLASRQLCQCKRSGRGSLSPLLGMMPIRVLRCHRARRFRLHTMLCWPVVKFRLDTGGYGTLIISKSISIVAIGVQASIAIPLGGTGITINAAFGDVVSLRGLIIDGQGVGHSGIVFNTGLSLEVVDCVVRNMAANGLEFHGKATTTQQLAVSNSYFADNGIDGTFIETTNLG